MHKLALPSQLGLSLSGMSRFKLIGSSQDERASLGPISDAVLESLRFDLGAGTDWIVLAGFEWRA
jgi:hypothetical protein